MREDTEVMVWDPLVSTFHWTLAVAFFAACLTGET
jgi:cytochrome b